MVLNKTKLVDKSVNLLLEQTVEPTIQLPITVEMWSSVLDTQQHVYVVFVQCVMHFTCVRPAESCSHSL